MAEINYRKLIRRAWDFSQNEKRLMYYYAFLPALITTITGIFYVVYQTLSFKHYFNHENALIYEIAKFGWQTIADYPKLIPVIIFVGVIVAFLYLLYPSFVEGAQIQFIARRYNGHAIKMRRGIGYGARSFFPILELHGIMGLLSFSSLLAYATLTWRSLGFEAFQIVAIILGVAAFLNIILAFLFTYAKYYIVIDRLNVFQAIGKSTYLVIDHWHSIILMFLILFFIGLRILLNIVLLLLIPGLIVLVGGLFASLALSIVGYVVAGLIGLAGLFLAGYLGGFLSLFAHSVWTFTFLELTDKEDDDARVKINS